MQKTSQSQEKPLEKRETLAQSGGDVNPEYSGSAKRTLVKAAGVMGLMTLLSRILGMTRDIVSAKSFGTTWQWDAFIYAFTLPNFFRRLVGEGALSSAFIPVYSEVRAKHGAEEANRFANNILTILTAGLVGLILAVELSLSFVLHRVALSERLYLTIDLLRIFFPYLSFISICAWAMGVLNCYQRFFSPALNPVILDLMWIAGVLWVAHVPGLGLEKQLHWLSFVIFISGAVQMIIQIPSLLKIGFRFSWIWDLADANLKKAFYLLLPAIMSFAMVQINVLVDMTLGFWIGPGANSSLWYGTRLMQFPLGVFAIGMGTALLPLISAQAARQDFQAAKKTMSFALRSVFLIILPSSVGLIVLKTPIIRLLFERGEFDAVSTARTAAVLMCYSIGLFAFAGEKIVAAGFYAVQDPRTPVKMGAICLAIDIVLNFILMIPFKEAGLALATSIAGILEFVILMALYDRKISNFPTKEIIRSFVKILIASVLMGIIALASIHYLEHLFPGRTTLRLLIQVFGSIVVSSLAYIGLCYLLKVHEMHEAIEWLRKVRKK